MKVRSKKTSSKKAQASSTAPPVAPVAPKVSTVARDVMNNRISASRSHLLNDALISFGATGASASEIRNKAQALATSQKLVDKTGAPFIVKAERAHLNYLIAHGRAEQLDSGAYRATDMILKQIAPAKKLRKARK